MSSKKIGLGVSLVFYKPGDPFSHLPLYISRQPGSVLAPDVFRVNLVDRSRRRWDPRLCGWRRFLRLLLAHVSLFVERCASLCLLPSVQLLRLGRVIRSQTAALRCAACVRLREKPWRRVCVATSRKIGQRRLVAASGCNTLASSSRSGFWPETAELMLI